MEFAGTIVGRAYRLVSEVEQGWIAEPVTPIGSAAGAVRIRNVAGVTADDPVAVATVTEWVRRASGVRHPNVVPVLDLVSHEDGYWIVYAPSDRPTLLDAIRDGGPMSARYAAEIGTQLVGAVVAASDAGIEVDLQPVNVLLDPIEPEVRVDLAMALERHLRIALPGTPFPPPAGAGYLNLDPVRRDGDGGANVFGLAVTLFFALEARMPHLNGLASSDRTRLDAHGDIGKVIAALFDPDLMGRQSLGALQRYLRFLADRGDPRPHEASPSTPTLDEFTARRGQSVGPPPAILGGPPPSLGGLPPGARPSAPTRFDAGPPTLRRSRPPAPDRSAPPRAPAQSAPPPAARPVPPPPASPGGPPPASPVPPPPPSGPAAQPVSPTPAPVSPAAPPASPVPSPPMPGSPSPYAGPPAARRRSDRRGSSPLKRAQSASPDDARARRTPSRVERAVSRTLRQGLLSFAAPDSMRQGRKERIEVGIAREESDRAELDRGFRTSGQRVTETVQTADYMTVELVGDAFAIVPLSPSTQVIAQAAHWEFDVTPVRPGARTLTLKGTSLISIDGGERAVAVPSFDRTINVDVDVMYGLRQFTGTNWQWILGTVVALGGAIAGWISLF